MTKHLHIISLDVPYPPDYGGVFDLYYKLPALAAKGVKIHLHCFDNGRGRQPALEAHCESVDYYPRKTGKEGFSFSVPYIVQSRWNEDLLQKLSQDDYPILMEGIHCSALLLDDRFRNRKLLLRAHNVEHLYYRQLARSTRSLYQKFYFWHEAHLLKKYEKKIANSCDIACVCQKDANYYRNTLKAQDVSFVPVFLPYKSIRPHEDIGNFCLYHGNLSVPENEEAAIWLIDKVFTRIKIPFVIAGKNPSARLKKMAHLFQHTCLIENPSQEEMTDLIKKAQINILPSFNRTGIKLKLLHALYEGKHCLVNDAAVEETGLEPTCHIANQAESMASVILQLYHLPFTEDETVLRKDLLCSQYNNSRNADELIQHLY